MLNKEEVGEVLKRVKNSNPLIKEVEEFSSFYLRVLEGLDETETDPKRANSHLYLNLKMAISFGASWVQGKTNRYKANKFVYSTVYNEARDLVRRALETEVLRKEGKAGGIYKGGHWDHLEVFPTRKMLPRRKDETARDARRRHLKERTVPPRLSAFLRVANATSKLAVFQEIIKGWLDNLLYLEALASGYKEKDLEEEGLGHFSLRKESIRWIRGIRWGDIDPRRELKHLSILDELPRMAGPVLREKMPEFLRLLGQNPLPLNEMRIVVEKAEGETKKSILQLIEGLEELE